MAQKKVKLCNVKNIKKYCDKFGDDSKKCKIRKEKCGKD